MLICARLERRELVKLVQSSSFCSPQRLFYKIWTGSCCGTDFVISKIIVTRFSVHGSGHSTKFGLVHVVVMIL